MEDTATQLDPLTPYYFKPEKEVICGLEVKPITADYVDDYPSVVDRFFTRYYYVKPGADRAPYQVLFHSNRICLICLASDHPAFSAGIKSLTFDIGNLDRSKNTVSGKGKRGGMILQADSTLALLTTEDGKQYKVPSCIRGKLVEVNANVVENPQLLQTADGYIGVLLPKIEICESIKASLMTQEQYNEYKQKLLEDSKRNGQDISSSEKEIS